MHRERQQVDLVAVAEQTKIKLALLEGLERDDLSHWPRGIFRRSYVRAYATAIGLDPELVIREFLERHPEPVEDVTIALAAVTASGRPPTRLRFLVDTAIGALAKRRHSQPAAAVSVTDEGSRVTAPAATSLPGSAPQVPYEPADESPVLAELAMRDSGAAGVGGLELDAPMSFEATAVEDRDIIERRALSIDVEPRLAEAHDHVYAPDDESSPVAVPDDRISSVEPDLGMLARLCTKLGRAADLDDVAPVLEEAATAIDAVGLVLWVSDRRRHALVPVLAAGYPDDLVTRLPGVGSDSDTAIATAFRTGEPCIVDSDEAETGAVSVPITTTCGCTGVLAIELRDGAERRRSVVAFASILAAQLAALVTWVPEAEAISA